MLAALTLGLLLGLASGLAPGPLMALVIAQTLQHGPGEGRKVALAPLITDVPVIVLAVLLASKTADFQAALGVMSLAGGGFVIYLGWGVLRRPMRNGEATDASEPRSWSKGILTNVLSPHPWLFWMTAGVAALANALKAGSLAAGTFLVCFYVTLVGSKLALVSIAARSRPFLSSRPYRVVMGVLAVLLAGFGVLLVREGMRMLLG